MCLVAVQLGTRLLQQPPYTIFHRLTTASQLPSRAARCRLAWTLPLAPCTSPSIAWSCRAAGKRAAECLTMDYHREHGLEVGLGVARDTRTWW